MAVQSQNSEKDLIFQTSLGYIPRESWTQVMSPYPLGRHTVLAVMLTNNRWAEKTADSS